MPEGPEVQCITDQLDFYLNNRLLTEVEWIGKDEVDVFSLPVMINRVWCKGKLIFFDCEYKNEKKWIVNSLRMTGTWSLEKNKYTKVAFSLLPNSDLGIFDIHKIYFNDVRSFGTFEFIEDEAEFREIVEGIADSFIGDTIIKYNDFYKLIKKQKNGFLVSKLMDQRSICSGIGNYLLSEILYECEFHPEIKCIELDDDNIKLLYNVCSTIISSSYREGGLTIRDYTGVSGTNGSYGKYIKVYGRTHDPHGNRISKIKGKHGRSIWFVSGLQRKR
jgi:formamidopyrimidine-DNA glycosylase